MNDVNIVSITGNLTREPELKATQGGGILHFGVAVNDSRKSKATGEWEEFPNFVDCVTFGKRAEALSRILAKGTKVAVSGKLRYSSWETKDGQKRSKLEVVADEVVLMSRRGDAPAQQTAQEPFAAGAPRREPKEQGLFDDDIPF